MSKITVYSKEAQSKLVSGVQKLSRAVSVTMGPRGKNVIIGKPIGAPVITKDGATVAREMILDDPIESLACQLVKEVAGRTAVVAGDGTTTATVLTDEILKLGSKALLDGHSPIDFRDGMDWAVNQITAILDKNAIKTPSNDDIVNIAVVSTNNDITLGSKIGEAYNWAGKDGTVGAEAYPGIETKVTKLDGVSLKSGYSSPAFLKEPNDSEVMLEDCKIIIIDRKMSNISPYIKILNEIQKSGSSVLIVSRGIHNDALKPLVENSKRGTLNVCCVSFPKDFKNYECIDDLAILTGAQIVSDKVGNNPESLRLSDLGHADRVVVDRFKTQMFNPKTSENRKRVKIAAYKADCDQPIGDEDRLELKRRISFLTSKAAIISVGYNTELELREKSDRVEDAMHATYAAITEGVLAGGGTSLLYASNEFINSDIPEKWRVSAKILADACVRPIRQILFNAGMASDEIILKILNSKSPRYGYNVITGEYSDMIKTGIVDPLKVTKTALKNSVSVAMLLLNTGAVLAELPDLPSDWQPPSGWRPPEGFLNHKY